MPVKIPPPDQMYLLALARSKRILEQALLDADPSLEPCKPKTPMPERRLDSVQAPSALIVGFPFDPKALQREVPEGTLGCKNGHPATRERSHCPICGAPFNTLVKWTPSDLLVQAAASLKIDPVRLYSNWFELRTTLSDRLHSYGQTSNGVRLHEVYARDAGTHNPPVPGPLPITYVMGTMVGWASYTYYPDAHEPPYPAQAECRFDDLFDTLQKVYREVTEIASLLHVQDPILFYHTVTAHLDWHIQADT